MFHDVSRVIVCGRRNTFATFSEDALNPPWQAQHFGDLRCHFAWQAQHFRRVVLHVFCGSHCQRCAKWRQGANSVAGVAFCDIWWKTNGSHTLYFTLYTLHSTLCTLHFILHTPHSTPHTYTPHFTLYTPHFTLHTAHFTLHALHFTLYTPHFTLHTLHSTLYTPFHFSHSYDSGVRYHTCEHSGSWASSGFFSDRKLCLCLAKFGASKFLSQISDLLRKTTGLGSAALRPCRRHQRAMCGECPAHDVRMPEAAKDGPGAADDHPIAPFPTTAMRMTPMGPFGPLDVLMSVERHLDGRRHTSFGFLGLNYRLVP